MAQSGSISGRVTSKETKSAIARASVFLSNSSFGTITSNEGNFSLNNLRPGQYTLTVTILGYEDFTKTVLVNDAPIKIDIELEPKAIQLREVVISSTSAADWKRNYAQFREEFIGTDQNAKSCDVINPKILNFTYHRTQQVLEADADEFLIVDNRALGYRVKFLLRSFKSDKIAGLVAYGGERLFEELPGTAAQKKKWKINRDLAYYGSAMHFYRSLYTDKLKEEGFEVRKLTRIPNPERPDDQTIVRKINMYKTMRRIDSANHWIDIANLPRYAKEKVWDVPWFSVELLRTTQQPGIFALTFPDYLYVMYTRKREETPFKDVFRPLDMPNYETTVVTLLNKGRYTLFDKNGIVVDESPLYEGTWSKSRLSELLPVDYVPSDKQ
ncbi:MAG TPA: carboxypeptidase-like regulatory domain-containing protein [Mucilaginibacter sp.]|nr:carboxypeptidase-like regulatory domain-containing protein [Mucilaginibacter sp.]